MIFFYQHLYHYLCAGSAAIAILILVNAESAVKSLIVDHDLLSYWRNLAGRSLNKKAQKNLLVAEFSISILHIIYRKTCMVIFLFSESIFFHDLKIGGQLLREDGITILLREESCHSNRSESIFTSWFVC